MTLLSSDMREVARAVLHNDIEGVKKKTRTAGLRHLWVTTLGNSFSEVVPSVLNSTVYSHQRKRGSLDDVLAGPMVGVTGH
jgi:hypothetical protein